MLLFCTPALRCSSGFTAARQKQSQQAGDDNEKVQHRTLLKLFSHDTNVKTACSGLV